MPDVSVVPNAGWDERIWAFQYKQVVTCFAVVSERYVLLLDTLVNQTTAGVMVAAIQDQLHAGRHLLVVNTHADWDHCWGNALFAGPDARHPAPIVGSRLCRERMLSTEAQAGLAQMQQDAPQTFGDVRSQPPTLVFDGRLMIGGGDLTFELVSTPGHTPDHIAVWVPQIRTLFAGDAAEAPLPFVGDPGSLPELRASLARLAALDPATVFYCHAAGRYDAELLRTNSTYFDVLEQRARAALAAGRIPADLAEGDVEASVGYLFDELPSVHALEPDQYAFYRDGHRGAIQAMLTYLRR